jgi:hypothetical protein
MWLQSMFLAIAVIAASACTTTYAKVTPIDIAQQARPLVQEGSAVVTGLGGTLRVSASDIANIRVRDGALERSMQVSVRELVAGCVDGGAAAPGCLAGQVVNEPAIERPRVRFDRARAGTAISFGLMGGAIVACLATCGDTSSLEKGAVAAGGGLLAIAALFLLVGSIGR